MDASTNKLLLFLKEPVVGKVKTRLGAVLGMEKATEIYKKFILYLSKKNLNHNYEVHVYYSETQNPLWLKEVFSNRTHFHPQIGGNLGQRLSNAINSQFKTSNAKLVILGGDSPDLPLEYINNAFASFKTHDICIGPSHDGGYYLIGLGHPIPEIFENISWGENTVFKETLDICEKLNKPAYILPKWWDVDTVEDYQTFLKRNPDF